MKKVPTIVLSVSYKGVKFIDATNKVSPGGRTSNNTQSWANEDVNNKPGLQKTLCIWYVWAKFNRIMFSVSAAQRHWSAGFNSTKVFCVCKSVSLEITNIRLTMVEFPAAVCKCRTMRHYFKDESLICASLRHAAAARTKSRANNRARKNHHLMRPWPWCQRCKPPCSKWDMLKKHLKDNYKPLTCKNINNIKVMHKSALTRSGKLHNLHIIRIFSLQCSSSGSTSHSRSADALAALSCKMLIQTHS